MIVALDAGYDEDASTALGAAVVFQGWDDAAPWAEHTAVCRDVANYVPGQFYTRELPVLLEVLNQVQEPIDLAIIDGYVSLGERPGLGWRLWEATGRRYPVIGVAKSRFHGATPVEITRGRSKTPLYITAVGIHSQRAAAKVRSMHGPFRLPTLLKRADVLTRR